MLTTELKTQPGSSDTYSEEQNQLYLSTINNIWADLMVLG